MFVFLRIGHHRCDMFVFLHVGHNPACAPPLHMQARVKTLAKNCKVDDYIEILPASPATLLRSFPRVAHGAFDANNLPVTSPLNGASVDFLASKITIRGGQSLKIAHLPSKSPALNSQPDFSMTGLCMPTAQPQQ